MTTPTLIVRRLTASLREDTPPSDATGRAAAVERLLREVAETRLAQVWARVSVPPGHWCLRGITVSWHPDRDGRLAVDWAQCLTRAVEQALTRPGAEAIHYRTEADALVDLVAELARGRADRAWAWRQLDLLAADGPDPEAAPGPALRAALERHPALALPSVVAASARCGLAALDRALTVEGWARLATLAWSTHAPRASLAVTDAPPGSPEIPVSDTPTTPAPTTGILLRGSGFADAAIRSRLRPGPATVRAWAVLAALDADPGLPHRAAAPAVVAGVHALLAGRFASATETRNVTRNVTRDGGWTVGSGPADPGLTSQRADGRPGAGRDVADDAQDPSLAGVTDVASDIGFDVTQADRRSVPGSRPASPRACGTPAATAPPNPGPLPNPVTRPATRPAVVRRLEPVDRRAEQPCREPVPVHEGEPPDGRPTRWAGLPFLHAVATEAGLPDALADDPALASRPASWCLHRIGRLTAPVPPDDAGLAALAGVPAVRAAAIRALPEPTGTERAVLERITRHWTAALERRLRAAGWNGPGDAVPWVAHRSGRVVADPGWIEVHLPVTTVDVLVRRAALDVDPGWVSWLGAVVRYVYE